MPAKNIAVAPAAHQRDFPVVMVFILVSLVFCLAFARLALAGGGANVLRSTLSNGLRVIIVRDPLAPVVTTAWPMRRSI